MTPGAGGARSGVPLLWVVPMGVIAGSLAAVAANVVSGALVLDLLAWWPAWLGLGILAWLGRGRRIGRVRFSGLVPILAGVVTVVFVVGHIRGWPAMPSAALDLIGPDTASIETAKLDVSFGGRVELEGGSRLLYEVTVLRWAGDQGVPEALEQTQESRIDVVLTPAPASGLATFSGWDVKVSADVVWEFDLAGIVDADLRGLEVSGVAVAGSGKLILGEQERPAEAVVAGDFRVAVPPGYPVRVVGSATVPAGWEQTEDGWRSPAVGQGWTLTALPGARMSVIGG